MTQVQVKCDICGQPATLMFEASDDSHGHASYARTCAAHVRQTTSQLKSSNPKQLKFMSATADVDDPSVKWEPWPEQ